MFLLAEYLLILFSPSYGELGFNSSKAINQRARDIHIHNDPIDADVYEKEVVPWQSRLNDFFQPSIRDLQHIIGNFALQEIESSIQKHKSTAGAPSSTSAFNTTYFLKLKSLAKSHSGNWSDVIELLSVFHSTTF